MNIFIKIKNSIYSPKYYKEVIAKPFSYSFKFYMIFSLLFALAFAIFVTVKFIPTENFLAGQVLKVSDYFPEGLVINIKDGKASTNAPTPYAVKLPDGYKNSGNVEPNMQDIENIIVLDTENKFNLDTFSSYKTLALLSSDSLIYRNENNQIVINSLSQVNNFTLDRSVVVGLTEKVKPFILFIYPIVFVGAYVAGFIIGLARLVYLFMGALLIWLVASVKGVKIGYKKAYQTGLHLMIPAIIITSLVGLIPINFTIPYLFTILLILSASINLNKEIAQPVASAV